MGEPIEMDELRVGTQEREEAIKVLGEHLSEGRLALDEYEQRAGQAAAARTRGDLRPLFRDLPAPYPPFMTPPARAAQTLPVPVYPERTEIQVAEPSDRYRVVAGVLQILFPFGVGRFYTGHTGIALAQLLTMFIGVGVVWSVIDGIIMLVRGGEDGYGRPLRF